MFSDPIADMLTRIRNGYQASKKSVSIPYSNLKKATLKVLKETEYISDYTEEKDGNKKFLKVTLLYKDDKPAITSIKRISKSGRRVYKGKEDLPYVLSGLGIAIVSTSKGVMTARNARKQSLGGEIICKIW